MNTRTSLQRFKKNEFSKRHESNAASGGASDGTRPSRLAARQSSYQHGGAS